ncbi:MAG: Branched-chain amino acid transport system / permease component [Firmicutes bacterium ADurb.Bin300]|nr:MAG: Branched-chain amino acid transport system / permease component [Firmicutes bacterium ADurb.Bin300]HOD02323.1 ABC transporter permease [Clostridiales bacterium]
MKNRETMHEPLIRISKKDSMQWYKSWAVRTAAIALALILCAFVIILLTGYSPIEVYKAVFAGSFGSERKVWLTFQKVAMLLCISLAVTPAFKMRFWNIGAEGQVLAGALATSACMIYLGSKLPPAALIPIMAAASIAAGLIWCFIPAFFKANFKTNETLFTLMMNYVAVQAVAYCIILWENPKGSNSVGIINPSSHFGWLPSLFNQKYLLNILIVFSVTVAMYIYLKYSKHGYEISVVGESENTAKYIGINVKKVILRTAALSGAICGLAGFLLVSGTDHTISTTTAGGQGFTAIIVSWLAKFNPIVMMLTSFLLIFLERGAGEIATVFRLNQSISEILSGIILFFIIGSEFFINYTVSFRKKNHKEGKK